MTIVVRKSEPKGRDFIVNVYEKKKRVARLRARARGGVAETFVRTLVEDNKHFGSAYADAPKQHLEVRWL